LRHATQRTHPGRGRCQRDLDVIVSVSAPATPKQTARDEARARAPEHAWGLLQGLGQADDGRLSIGDPQEDAQVEGTQVLAVHRFQEAVESQGSVAACKLVARHRQWAFGCFEGRGHAARAGRGRPGARSGRVDVTIRSRSSIVSRGPHRDGGGDRGSRRWRQVGAHAPSIQTLRPQGNGYWSAIGRGGHPPRRRRLLPRSSYHGSGPAGFAAKCIRDPMAPGVGGVHDGSDDAGSAHLSSGAAAPRL
jgi:hypothetical protein